MKYFLVPTDFSDASMEAFHYAKQLATVWGAQIRLVYIWHPSYNAAIAHGNVGTIIPPANPEKRWRDSLNHFADRVGHPRDQTELIPGFAADKLVELSEGEQCDLIIMGTSGDHDFLDRVFGSISSQVSQEAHCPVLLVPEGYALKDGFRNILYGTTFYASNEDALDEVLDFAQHFKANIHFVHVQTDEEDTAADNLEDMLYQQLYDMHHAHVDVQTNTVRNDDVMAGLYDYATANQIDLLVLVARERTWWEDLITFDNTERMLFNPKFPMLVLHLNARQIK